MNRRFRNRSAAVDGYFRYLKPGALAQLRDRKINAKTHYRLSDSQISSVAVSPSRSTNAAGSGQQQEGSGSVDGELPLLSQRLHGPRCPQRKKLMAVRSVSYSEPFDASAPVIDAFAH